MQQNETTLQQTSGRASTPWLHYTKAIATHHTANGVEEPQLGLVRLRAKARQCRGAEEHNPGPERRPSCRRQGSPPACHVRWEGVLRAEYAQSSIWPQRRAREEKRCKCIYSHRTAPLVREEMLNRR